MKSLPKYTALAAAFAILAGCSATPASTSDTAAAPAVQQESAAFGISSVQDDAASVLLPDSTLEEAPSEPAQADVVSITLSGDTAAADSDAVTVDGSTVTITAAGVYRLSGTLADGQLIVDAAKEDEVELLLDEVSITSQTSAPIYVRSADKVKITLTGDNTLENGGTFTAIDENNIDAVIFSKEDLTLKGDGTLTVNSPAGHGIVSKDDLKLKSGTYTIYAASHGVSANDSITLEGGDLTITSGKDGLHVENADDATLGNLVLADGTLDITANGDGLSASGTMDLSGGDVTVLTQVGDDDTASMAGLKAAGLLTISGGTYTLDTVADAIHSDTDVSILDGDITLSTGDDGIHADNSAAISGGNLNILTSYEGIEGTTVSISGGYLSLYATDDGINAGGGADSSGFGGPMGGDQFGGSGLLSISGGEIHVNAEGDGLDSNGSLDISGGTIYISGPTSSGNGTLDYDGSAAITGGTLMAAGAAGMAQNFTSAEQGAILLNVGSQEAGAAVTVTDESGNALLTFTPEKAYSSVNLSSPELVSGGTYTITAGTYSETITLDGTIYGAGGMGGRGGF